MVKGLSASGQEKWFKGHITTLMESNIKPPSLEFLVADRHTWSSACHWGISHLQEKITERRGERCERTLSHLFLITSSTLPLIR